MPATPSIQPATAGAPVHEDLLELPLAAAIVDDLGVKGAVDQLLAAVACLQRRAGRAVRGLLMTYPDVAAGCAGEMVLVDIDTLDEYLVSQPLGAGSNACRADAQGFARASRVLRDALAQQPDLVIVNRFGRMEAEGEGYVDELLALMSAGVPLLTVVAERHLEAWQRFSGGATVLPAEAGAVAEWLERVLPVAAD
jgi:hypothetical protein